MGAAGSSKRPRLERAAARAHSLRSAGGRGPTSLVNHPSHCASSPHATQESDAAGGPTLLPEGQRQAYDVGVAFRERYMSVAGCSRCATDT